jgi:hypothetical protein
MATTKKGTASKKAPAGARRDATKANGVAKAKAKETRTKPAAPSNGHGATAARKPAPVRLTDRQTEFLKKIHEAGESGYTLVLKAERRTIEALLERKLLKRGAKNKETGQPRFLLTKAGAKHLPSTPAAPAPAPAPSSAPEPMPAEPATTA